MLEGPRWVGGRADDPLGTARSRMEVSANRLVGSSAIITLAEAASWYAEDRTPTPLPTLSGRPPAMKTTPRAGMTGEERITVDASNRIVFADDRMPAVLATPWLVAHLEYAARHAIAPCLEENERSVGTFVEVEHLGPAPRGIDRRLPGAGHPRRWPERHVPGRGPRRGRGDCPGHSPPPGHRRRSLRPADRPEVATARRLN